jgi:hypothetical protein
MPGEAEPGLQGGEKFHTSTCRKGREMGFVGPSFARLSPPVSRKSDPAETRIPSDKTEPAEAASECCIRVAAGGLGRVAEVWRPGNYRGEIRRIFVRSDSARRPHSDGRGAPGGLRSRGLSRVPTPRTPRGAVCGQDGEDQHVLLGDPSAAGQYLAGCS